MRAVRQLRVEAQGDRCGWHDLPTHGEDAVGLAHALLEVPGDIHHGRDEQVPEGVAGQPGLSGGGREAVLHEAVHGWFGVSQGRDAVADVADRRHSELLAQLAR